MLIRGDKKRVCGHMASDHTIGVFNHGNEIVNVKEVFNNPHIGCGICLIKNCEKFTLPNLDLVEYLAEERNLI